MTLDTFAVPTLLVVEPDPDTCELYAEWFAVGGFSVVAAADAESALAMYTKHRPVAVVMEIRLQPFDGLELLARFKSMPGTQRVPVVVVTSQADARSQMRALVAGAVEVVAKPCDFQQLCGIVAGAVASIRPGTRRRGRPAAGLKGQRTSEYPQLSVRLPPETRAALWGLASAQKRPMWRVLVDALTAWERREMGKELRNTIAELRMRARLNDSADILRGLPETVRDFERSVSVLVADNDARYVAVNEAAARLTGYTREELLASTVWDITPAPDLGDGRAAWHQFLRDREFDGLYRLKRKDGSTVWVHVVAVAHLVRGLHVSALAEVSNAAVVAA
jgi:two-component system, cell cycle response regulator DivK